MQFIYSVSNPTTKSRLLDLLDVTEVTIKAVAKPKLLIEIASKFDKAQSQTGTI